MWRLTLSSDVMHTNEVLANETYWYIIHEINHDENEYFLSLENKQGTTNLNLVLQEKPTSTKVSLKYR